MTRRDAIAELIAKVEAGDSIWPAELDGTGVSELLFGNAYNRSLDAAKALHDAVLPGWVIGQIGQSVADGSGVWNAWIVAPDYLESCVQSRASASDPARALLLAGLRALHAQEQA
jgi:hypothetical protein